MAKRARPLAQVQTEWEQTGALLNQLDAAVGLKPWDTSISDPDWRNPQRPGTPEHAALEEVHEEALRLARQWARLRAELERAEVAP